jgi:hypothetical protein
MRSGATARVRIRWDEPDDVEQEDLEFEATDVRPAGAFLPSDLMFEHGAPLAVRLELPGVGEAVLRAEVVAVDLSGQSYGRPGMGIRFRSLPAAHRRALRALGDAGPSPD